MNEGELLVESQEQIIHLKKYTKMSGFWIGREECVRFRKTQTRKQWR